MLTDRQDDKEREPAKKEGADDDAQRLGGFFLASEFQQFCRETGGGRRVAQRRLNADVDAQRDLVAAGRGRRQRRRRSLRFRAAL